VGTASGERIAEARAALTIGDAAAARLALGEADAIDRSAAELEVLARAAYIDLEFTQAIDLWEAAYGSYRGAGDLVGAVRVGRTLAPMYFLIVGDPAVANGWIARAQTLLADDPESSERGWVTLDIGMFEPQRERKNELLRDALAVARSVDDRDLEVVTLAYLGASLVHGDAREEGMAMLDEALAAVAGQEVDDFCVLEEVFCQLFSACEHARDVARADAWICVGDAIAQRRRLPAVSAFCRTHYGGCLTAAGRWAEAEEALTSAIRLWALGRRSALRTGALARLADLRVRQGRFEEAEQVLAGVEPFAADEAVAAWAAIELAKGNTTVALDIVERALDNVDPTSTSAVPLLELLVEIHLADGSPSLAAGAADRLARCAHLHPANNVRAAAALASGRVCVATGEGDPRSCFRAALDGFRRAQMPMELALARLELARVVAGERPEVALIEARAAYDVFEQLQATGHAAAAASVLRSLGAPVASPRSQPGTLSRREAEVLELLGHGLSNPDIASRLYISRKTVEHHVGNILAKLGLRSRSEAAAYSIRASYGSAAEQARQ
jgi:DNA-binding NarL/FixJ family response regulator